jgi:hypothetical protein
MRYCLPALFLTVSMSQAATVYRTVDENGVVSFSDSPPQSEVPVEEVELNVPPVQSGDEYVENLQAMRETTDRMAADRREREKHRAQMRELEARVSAYEAPPQQDYRDYASYYPNYYPVYRPRRPIHGKPPWRPSHPIVKPISGEPVVRPPLRPGYGNSSHHSLRKGVSLNRGR